MPRTYPRFLFSNPQNTKSKGPFIIHTLSPQLLCRLIDRNSEDPHELKNFVMNVNGIWLELLEEFTYEPDSQKTANVIMDMGDWLRGQPEAQAYKPK